MLPCYKVKSSETPEAAVESECIEGQLEIECPHDSRNSIIGVINLRR